MAPSRTLTERERAERIILLGENSADPIGGAWKVTRGLSTQFDTDHLRVTPIAETSIVGAAISGFRFVAQVFEFHPTAEPVTLALGSLTRG